MKKMLYIFSDYVKKEKKMSRVCHVWIDIMGFIIWKIVFLNIKENDKEPLDEIQYFYASTYQMYLAWSISAKWLCLMLICCNQGSFEKFSVWSHEYLCWKPIPNIISRLYEM